MNRIMMKRLVTICILLISCCVTAVTATSKCYYTFFSWSVAFHAVLNNPTTEILEEKYFPNFNPYIPFIFDDKGKVYNYNIGMRKWLGTLAPVYIGQDSGQRFWIGPNSRIVGLIPDNSYYFFLISKIITEDDYVVSNIFNFHLDNEYKIDDEKVILWSDLPKIVQVSAKTYMKSYLPQMGVEIPVDYFIEELGLDKRNQIMPEYRNEIHNAAYEAYKKKVADREALAPKPQSTYKETKTREEIERYYYEVEVKMFKDAGKYDEKVKTYLEKKYHQEKK